MENVGIGADALRGNFLGAGTKIFQKLAGVTPEAQRAFIDVLLR